MWSDLFGVVVAFGELRLASRLNQKLHHWGEYVTASTMTREKSDGQFAATSVLDSAGYAVSVDT